MTLIEVIRKHGKSARLTGILLIVVGILALLAPLAAGLSITLLIGGLLLFAGLVQLSLVFRTGSFGQGLVLVILGLLSLFAGLFSIMQPAEALAALTLVLAAFFAASGVIEVATAFAARPSQGWGWLLFNGIVSLLLGFIIWQQFPLSGVWAVGVLVGVRLLTTGWLLVAIGGAAANVADTLDSGGGN
ncbi:HdeD family acid-resistance protein [Haliea sp. E17]|uniref:HdeD family acid-resistance protein n=1 Tax=Haliea sp. E17 TaxID=3401576 RepID=UPI003AAF9C2C